MVPRAPLPEGVQHHYYGWREDESAEEVEELEVGRGISAEITIVELSLNSIVGLTRSRTMKLVRLIDGNKVVVIVDPGPPTILFPFE